jgi:hypothetical protein
LGEDLEAFALKLPGGDDGDRGSDDLEGPELFTEKEACQLVI